MLIPLKNSELFAEIDDEDFILVSKYSWSIQVIKNSKLRYAYANGGMVNGKRVCVYMHRVVLQCDNKKIKVDHKNSNGLNNKKENLRECTHAENMRNRKVSHASKTGIKNVHPDSRYGNNRFRVEVRVNGVKHFRGGIYSLGDAIKFRNELLFSLHKEFAHF